MIYYGGGDKHVCLAETPLDKFLDWMLRFGNADENITPFKIN